MERANLFYSETQHRFYQAIKSCMAEDVLWHINCHFSHTSWQIEEEVPIGLYRPDVLVTLRTDFGPTKPILITQFDIECDGPQHYRPSQANKDRIRDRRLFINRGIYTLRYPVKQLDDDNKYYAQQVVTAMMSKLHESTKFVWVGGETGSLAWIASIVACRSAYAAAMYWTQHPELLVKAVTNDWLGALPPRLQEVLSNRMKELGYLRPAEISEEPMVITKPN